MRADLAYLTGRLTGGAAPAAVGAKFTAGGQVLPWPGNTFLCHIPPGPAHDALSAAQARLRAGPLAGAFAFLPPASFHMTVFEGADAARRGSDAWPAAIDPATPLPEVTDRMAAAARGLRLPPVATIRPAGIFGGFSVAVEGTTPADEAALRAMREALAQATTIRRADFAAYDFHITLGYLLRWLDAAEAAAVVALADEVAAGLAAAAPAIALGPVEFCTFADMHAFHPLLRLSHAPEAGPAAPWARPLERPVARLTPVPAATRAAWAEGRIAHAEALALAPALTEVETGGTAAAAGAAGALRVVAWNVERLRHLDAVAATLRASGGAVSLLSEIDKGMARSGNSDRIAELAARNAQAWAYGVEFIELGRGDPAERAATEGQENAEGFHGNAILSGLALHRPALLRLETEGAWFGPGRGQPRVGGRMALAAQVLLDGRAVTVVSVHLESHSDPDMRAAQMRRLIALVEAYDPAAPVVIGGDLNTATVDRRLGRCTDAARIARPEAWEPLFALAAARGFDHRACNLEGAPTQRLWPGEAPRPLGRIDWFLTRGLVASEPAVIPATDAAGATISDHEAIAVTLRLP